MKISFDTSKTFLVFVPEGPGDTKVLAKFPGFSRQSIYHVCPVVLPVAFNLIQRLRAKKLLLNFAPGIKEWLDQPFKLKALPESFKFHTSPKDFQEIALRYIYTLGSAGLLLDPGMGKSKVVLDYIHLMGFGKTLVVCPKPLMFVWEDEIHKHRPELNEYYCVETTDWAVEGPKIKAAKVVIINYTKAVIFKAQLKTLEFDFIHLDEFLIKDPKTDRTKGMLDLARSVKYRAGGSGTLINNSPLDAYAPLRYLQPSLVGGNYGNFLQAHTVQLSIKDPAGQKPERKQIVAFKGKADVRSMLDSCCIVMTKEQWLKLPEKKFIDVTVQMTPEQKEAYYSLLRNYYANIGGNHVEVDNPLVMLSKLYQISNGFLYIQPETEAEVIAELLPDGKEPKKKKAKRTTFYFDDNPKVTALTELVSEKLPGRRAIIWFNLEAEGKLIEQALTRLGHTYLVIKGGEKDVGGKVRQFNTDQNVRWLVCQAKSVNYGITVLGSKAKDLEDAGELVMPDIDTQIYTQIFFSLNFSLEVYLQQVDRIHRLGQDQVCEYYRILANSPVERKIKQALEEKLDLRHEMLIDVAKTMLDQKEEQL